MTQIEWDPQAEVRCIHVEQCGACPLMASRYEAQCRAKRSRLETALKRYGLKPDTLEPVAQAERIDGYRRRAKLVVAAEGGEVSVGLYRRNDNQHVVDIPECKVLRPELMHLVAEIRKLVAKPPEELRALMEPSGEGRGVLSGLDARSLFSPGETEPSILLTLILVAERTRSMDEMREAARALRRLIPSIAGVALSLRYSSRHHASSELISASGVTEVKDRVEDSYQLVSHTSFLHVHREQSEMLYALLCRLAGEALPESGGRVLDLYGGTGAIAMALAARGHATTLVESYPPAAALALRAAQAQRLPVEVVTGDVASVSSALARNAQASNAQFDMVVANPPRRGLSPAAREAIAAIAPKTILYVACDLNNLSRDLDHLSRLGFHLRSLHPLDMLPLTEEVEVVAVLSKAPRPRPHVIYDDHEIVVFNKPPHEPVHDQDEYPVSLVSRAKGHMDGGEWVTVLKTEPGTSGICIMARTKALSKAWQESLASNGRLVYLAAARGVTPAEGAITRELRGESGERKPARTRYRRLAIGGGHSVLRVVPEKRHTHQIRRHLAAIGHPVLGDARYGHGPTNRYFEEKHGLDRSFLHLVRVEVDHPITGARMLIEAPLPADLRAALVRASDESVLKFLRNKKALGDQAVRFRDTHGGPISGPVSERSPLSLRGGGAESIYPSIRPPATQRSPGAIELDEAPRTVRGELLTPDDD